MAALKCEICGGKLIGKPGGLFECEYCGMEYSTAWAKAKIQEIKGTVKVEGTVEVTGSVKVDGSVSAQSLLKRGQLALEDEEWETAKGYFEKTLDANPECAEAYFGLAMCETQSKNMEELVQLHQWENKYYSRGKRFADSALKQQTENMEQAYIAELNRVLSASERENLKQLRERTQMASSLLPAGVHHAAARKMDGTVVTIGRRRGYYETQEYNAEEWTDIVDLCVGFECTVGLKADGTVVAKDRDNRLPHRVNSWKNIVAICTGYEFTIGLRADGQLVNEGAYTNGLRDVRNWENVTAIRAGGEKFREYVVGLKDDGTVVAAGENESGRCNVSDWSGITAISAGNKHTVGLKSDGSVVAVGENEHGQCDVSSWRDIVAISAKGDHTVGLCADGRVVAVGENEDGQCNVGEWRNIIAIRTNSRHTAGLTANGKVLVVGSNKFGACNVRRWENIVAISTTFGDTIGLDANGNLVSTKAKCEYYCKGEPRLFQSMDALKQKMDEINKIRQKEIEEQLAQQKREEEARIARQKQEEEERLARLKREEAKRRQEEERRRIEEQKRAWRSDGLCQHCGGQLKGLFSKKCTACGKPKDY